MITNSRDVSNILEFAKVVGLTHVYAQIDSSISNVDWENFIGQFNASGIIVDALLGDADWVLEAGDLESELQWIEQYQNSASSNSKFTGIHMDVEVRGRPNHISFSYECGAGHILIKGFDSCQLTYLLYLSSAVGLCRLYL